jgi:phage baseplate assembly protein W
MSGSSSSIAITNINSGVGVQAPTSAMNILNDVNELYTLESPVLKVYGDDAINNFIYNLMTTQVGSRHWEPNFGSYVPYFLWEPCDDITAWQLETATYDAIKQWIPYIRPILSKTKIVPLPTGDGYSCFLPYVNLYTGKVFGFNTNLFKT